MASFSTRITGPSEWEREYAQSDAVLKVPFVKAVDNEGRDIINIRDVYLDIEQVLDHYMASVSVYTDVLALKEEKTILNVPKLGKLYLYTRLLTTSGSTHLVFPREECAVYIHASEVDGHITYSLADSDTVFTLDLGVGSKHVAVLLYPQGETVNAEYDAHYDPMPGMHPYFQQLLETQLRISSVLFWSQPTISLSLASHVAVVTAPNTTGPGSLLNMQAVALGRQLAAEAMTGPNMNYLPVLSVDSYLETLRASVDAAAAFETQYERFQDKSQSESDLRNAGEQMLEQAKERSKVSESLAEMALEKYEDASKAVRSTQATFRADRFVLQNAASDLKRGVQKWKEEESLKAAFTIITAIITFGVAIAEIALGDPEAAASIPADIKMTEKVIEDVKKVEGQLSKVKEVLQSQTMKNLRDCAKALYNLYTPMATSIDTLKGLDWSSKIDLPTTEQVSGADGDSAAIQSLASWDKWRLQADAQMEFPVSHGIEGADAYQLALRKHAINGKQLAQTQAEAIKAGQGYIQAKLEQHLARQDIESLTQLVQNLQSEKDTYEKAQARFFDRYLALRTTICIDMQNLIWAEKYITLSNSGVVVNPLKTVADYKADLSQIEEEIQNAKSNYSSGLQTFDYETPPNPLPLHYLSDMVQSLRTSTSPVGSPIRPYSATFTLMPRISKNDDLSGPFTDGSHFRVSGLDVTLIGVVPKVPGDLVVSLEISTSGTYADIQDGHSYNFTTLPLHREFRYRVGVDGEKHIEVTAIDTSNEYALPTPFTQWTIRVLNADDLDFSGLEEVKIDWHGKFRF